MAGESSQVGARLRHERTARRMTQQQLAAAVGISVRAIGDIENGRTKNPRWLGALERYFGVSFRGEPDEETYTDEAEAAIWALNLPVDQRRRLIAAIRESRRAAS